jgi:uncharacterized protein (TIGR03435 family)
MELLSARRFPCAIFLGVLVLASLTGNLDAQAPEVTPEFSVVSIHPSNPEGRPSYRWTGSGLSESGNTLSWLISVAYTLPEARFLEGAPSWTEHVTYDVIGKVDEEDQAALSAMPAATRGRLLRKVLADRFGLVYHWEPRTFSEYGLIVVNPSRASHAIVPSSPEESAKPRAETSSHSVEAHGMTMEQLCHNVLGTEARQLVVDQTGIAGKLNFQLRWSRVDLSAEPPPSAEASPDPDIFSAVQEQLGLKLVPLRVPVQVLVVDRVQKPSAN